MSKKPNLKPILPTDTPAVRKEIKTLLDRGCHVVRHSEYHLKIGSISYYPGKGTIMLDPHHVQSKKGLEALLELLDSLERNIISVGV